MKVLSNCTVEKLREYSKSYGSPEKISIPYIQEFDKYILLLTECGQLIRHLNKGTKLLIDFKGQPITERQFKIRTKKSFELLQIEKKQNQIKADHLEKERQSIVLDQSVLWADFLKNNPESKAKYILKVNTMPSSKWRNYLRMKAAKNINLEKFEGLEISAPELKNILFQN